MSCESRAAFESDLESAIIELQEVQTRLASLGSNLVKPSSLHDEKGSLLWISPSAANLLGYGDCESATPGKAPAANRFLDAVQVQDRVKIAHFLVSDDRDDEQEDVQPCVADFRRKDAGIKHGAPQWIEITKTCFTGKASGRQLTLVTYSDVTRAKQMEHEAVLVKEKSEEASVAKSRFLANISHELRTPLNAILGFSELLGSPIVTTFPEEKKNEYVGLIHESARHLLNLLNGILDMSKIENGMYEVFPESFSLRSCLEKTTAIMRGQADPRGISLVTSGFDELPDVVADERAIRQIMINLLSNAIKFSHDGGQVNVRASRMARTVQISVHDNGVGISAGHLANLGTPFFQADSKYDRKYDGTGLGLSVVKGLVELHKGTIRFDSDRGKGTTVTVSIPINARSGRQVPASREVHSVVSIKKAEADPSASSLRILRNTA